MPAGDMQRLMYACAFGADAVYAGAPRYSLRTRENGFSNYEKIDQAIKYVHSVGKRIYLAMNIFPHNNKIQGMLDDFCKFYDFGPDAFIVTDPGVISKMLKLRPKAKIHLSTQANATNWAAIEFYRDLGIKRIVIPRELSLKEITEIHNKVPDVELEAFVHGSVCMAYSGRCLISNYLTHRDSNQGNCANSCRWQYKVASEKSSLKVVEEEFVPEEPEYKELQDEYYISERDRPDQVLGLDEDEHGTYLFNSKDLCAIELLDDLRKAGIVSLKVEGRTKSIYYTTVVARAYRRALDDLRNEKEFNQENLKELIATSNRSLMTGFFTRKPSEYGQNYTDGGSQPLTHLYVGRIDRYEKDKKSAFVEFTNKITRGEELEVLTPHGNINFQVGGIKTEKGKDVEQISGGVKGWLEIPFIPEDFSIIRKKNKQTDALNVFTENIITEDVTSENVISE